MLCLLRQLRVFILEFLLESLQFVLNRRACFEFHVESVAPVVEAALIHNVRCATHLVDAVVLRQLIGVLLINYVVLQVV